MVAWEYDSTDGYQYSTDNDNDQPPTIFETTLTTSKATFESDIGVGSSDVTVASGVNYEVAFTNISTDCNTPDNIQVDVIPTYDVIVCPLEHAHDTPLRQRQITVTGDQRTALGVDFHCQLMDQQAQRKP